MNKNAKLQKALKNFGDLNSKFSKVLKNLTKPDMFGKCCVVAGVALNVLEIAGILPGSNSTSDLEAIQEIFNKLESKIDGLQNELISKIVQESIKIRIEIIVTDIRKSIKEILPFCDPECIKSSIEISFKDEDKIKTFEEILRKINNFIIENLQSRFIYEPLLKVVGELSELKDVDPGEVLQSLGNILQLNFSLLFRGNLALTSLNLAMEHYYNNGLFDKLQYFSYIDTTSRLTLQLETLKNQTVDKDPFYELIMEKVNTKIYNNYLSRRIKVGDLIYFLEDDLYHRYLQVNNNGGWGNKTYIVPYGMERGNWEGFYIESKTVAKGEPIEAGKGIQLKSRETGKYLALYKLVFYTYLHAAGENGDNSSNFVLKTLDSDCKEDDHILIDTKVSIWSASDNSYLGIQLYDSVFYTVLASNSKPIYRIHNEGGKDEFKIHSNGCSIF